MRRFLRDPQKLVGSLWQYQTPRLARRLLHVAAVSGRTLVMAETAASKVVPRLLHVRVEVVFEDPERYVFVGDAKTCGWLARNIVFHFKAPPRRMRPLLGHNPYVFDGEDAMLASTAPETGYYSIESFDGHSIRSRVYYAGTGPHFEWRDVGNMRPATAEELRRNQARIRARAVEWHNRFNPPETELDNRLQAEPEPVGADIAEPVVGPSVWEHLGKDEEE